MRKKEAFKKIVQTKKEEEERKKKMTGVEKHKHAVGRGNSANFTKRQEVLSNVSNARTPVHFGNERSGVNQ